MAGNRFDSLLATWQEEERASFTGWDFSHLSGRLLLETPPWSYADGVRELLPAAGSVLDLGTGGGEKLLEYLSDLPAHTVVTEGYGPNLVLAQERLAPLGIDVVACNDSLQQKLPFVKESFDLVINRHTSFNISEVERVLAPGGVFLTQQVDGRNLSDLSAAFDSEQPWQFFTLEFALEQIAETDFVVETADEWSGSAVFKDVGAVVYYLKAVPWTVPEGFSVAQHLSHLRELQARLEEEGELSFRQKLFMVKVRKDR